MQRSDLRHRTRGPLFRSSAPGTTGPVVDPRLYSGNRHGCCATPWWPLGMRCACCAYVTALLFIAHASMRFVYGSIPQFAWAMECAASRMASVWVLAITAYEIVRGHPAPAQPWRAVGSNQRTGGDRVSWHFTSSIGWAGSWVSTAPGAARYSVALLVMLLVLAAMGCRAVAPASFHGILAMNRDRHAAAALSPSACWWPC